MAKKFDSKPLAIALGTAFAASSFAGVASADSNPFQVEELKAPSSYTQLAEGNCGEGNCGEGNCGEKDGEGNCGEKDGEGNCGEGSCGGAKG